MREGFLEKIYVYIVPVVNSYPIYYSSRLSNSLLTEHIDSYGIHLSIEFARKCTQEIADWRLT